LLWEPVSEQPEKTDCWETKLQITQSCVSLTQAKCPPNFELAK